MGELVLLFMVLLFAVMVLICAWMEIYSERQWSKHLEADANRWFELYLSEKRRHAETALIEDK